MNADMNDREFVIWALRYVEGVALEMQDDDTGKRLDAIVKRLEQGEEI